MYWTIQEKFIFSLIFFILFLIQILSISLIREFHLDILLVSVVVFNFFAFLGMIYYAKWVWRTKTFIIALKKVIMYEVILILFFIIFWFIIKI